MEKKLTEIIQNLELCIESIETENDDTLHKAEKCIKVTKRSLEQIRDFVITYDFKDKPAEIHFFKNIKPQIYSKLIYYVKLFNIESERPRSSNKSQIKYLNKHIDKLQIYFNENLEFYHYYRRAATTLDEQYFIRGKADIRLYPDTFYFFTDKQFSTSHDSTVVTILAYDMLIIHLKTEIDKLENNNGMESTIQPFRNNQNFFFGREIKQT